MSRKRKKQLDPAGHDERRAGRNAVPDELLAEGSGPNEGPPASIDDLAHAAADVLDLELDLEAQLDELDLDDPEAIEAHVVAVLEQAANNDRDADREAWSDNKAVSDEALSGEAVSGDRQPGAV